MTLRIASAEIISILFMLVILGSSLHREEKKSLSHTIFVALITTTVLGLTFDVLAYYLDEGNRGGIILIIVNILAFSLIDLCIVSFSLYMLSIIRQKKDFSLSFLYPVFAICTLNMIMIIIGSINGLFFSIRDHRIRYGLWSELITIMPSLAVLFLLIILLMNIKTLGKRNSLALGSFVGFPIVAAVIVILFPDLQLAYLASALSCSIIFTFIRREEINESQIREEIMARVSSIDTLTGLMNRRAFDEVIGRSSDHENLGIVFSDLNALKYTNNNFGHAAGDDYIRRFADILRQVFNDLGSICRISGDEFVVLLYDISETDLNGLKAKMNEAIRENDRIASVGYAYGKSSAALELIRHAEQEMYDDKNRYYSETGRDRRRNDFS